jgi:outer membrane protein insertion porin family
MCRFSRTLSFFLFTLFIITVTTDAYARSGERINKINVTGIERLELTTVLTYLNMDVGDMMTEEALDKALKSLFATGLFADINLRQNGNILEVEVVENPVISQIEFEGNDDIDDEELLAEIQLRPRNVFTRTKVQNDVNRMYQIYRRGGRFSVNIEPKVIKLDQNRINLVFEINEGPITKVSSIRFVGNHHFSDNQLRSEISTKESRWYSFISSNDRYDPDRLAFDEELLRRYYLSKGYADFRVISSNAELSRNREHFYITFTIDEGERYSVGTINISSNIKYFDESSLEEYIMFESGDWYDAKAVDSSIDAMTEAMGDMQFAFVNIRPEMDRDRDDMIVDITFNINETPRVFVERIDIGGNLRTLDRVVRREFELVEGDPFNRTKIARSEQAIRDLGFFEEVKVENIQGSAPDKVVVDVEVVEQSTGELSIGGGFSTTDGPLADIRIRERNLLGKGQELSASATVAGEKTEFDVSFTEPYFLERDLSVGFDAFHIVHDLQDESSFDQRRTGGSFRLGYPLSEKWRQNLRYRIEQNEITDVNDDASRFIIDQENKRLTSAISQRTTYDDRDSVLFPTEGLYAWLDTEYAGLGGDANYLSGKIGGIYYYPVINQVVFNILGEAGAITGMGGKNVKINERYFIGGNTLRGFERAGIGPRDTSTNDSLGGNRFYRGSAELSFPVFLPEELGVKGHAFTDVGSLWQLDDISGVNIKDSNSLRATAGLGISWRSPLGPIRVDMATPYVSETYDIEENFRFSFGTRF